MPYAATSFWQRIRLLARQPTWWAEVSIAMSLTLWGILCMLDQNHLNHESFHLLVRLAPELVWERLALAGGAFHVLALVMNGPGPLLSGHNWRVAASLCSAWFLSFLVINFVSAKIIPPGSAFYLVPLCMDLLAIFKNIRRTA